MTKLHRTTSGPRWNEGARQSWIAMRARGLNQAAVNRRLGELTGTVPKLGYANRVLYGDLVPGLQIALAWESLLGVSPTLWSQPAIEPFSIALTGAEEVGPSSPEAA